MLKITLHVTEKVTLLIALDSEEPVCIMTCSAQESLAGFGNAPKPKNTWIVLVAKGCTQVKQLHTFPTDGTGSRKVAGDYRKSLSDLSLVLPE